MNGKLVRHIVWGLLGLLAAMPAVQAQKRPYVGYVYPAGGQQGTTFPIRIGGQGLQFADGMIVTGDEKVAERARRLKDQAFSRERRFLHPELVLLPMAIGCLMYLPVCDRVTT